MLRFRPLRISFTFDVLNLGDQVTASEFTENLVGSSVAKLSNLSDQGRGNDLVILGAHLSLSRPLKKKGGGGGE